MTNESEVPDSPSLPDNAKEGVDWPERIWAWRSAIDTQFWSRKPREDYATCEYIRADLAQPSAGSVSVPREPSEETGWVICAICPTTCLFHRHAL